MLVVFMNENLEKHLRKAKPRRVDRRPQMPPIVDQTNMNTWYTRISYQISSVFFNPLPMAMLLLVHVNIFFNVKRVIRLRFHDYISISMDELSIRMLFLAFVKKNSGHINDIY